MDIFEKLAEFSNETFSALKWIFLFISCVTFFALPFNIRNVGLLGLYPA